MAITTESFNADGVNKVFTPASTILSQSHCRVDFYYDDGSGELTDHQVPSNTWDIVNNSVVFNEAPTSGYIVKITVSTDGEGLETAPSVYSDLAPNIDNIIKVGENEYNINKVSDNMVSILTVASIQGDVETVANDIVAIRYASENATTAKLKAWEAEAAEMTSKSYAQEALGEYVKEYVSNGDGTFTETPTDTYSSLHYAKNTELLEDGADLNSIKETGVYIGNSNSTYSNLPVSSNVDFLLIVKKAVDSSIIIQTFIQDGTSIYIRKYTPDYWEYWREQWTEASFRPWWFSSNGHQKIGPSLLLQWGKLAASGDSSVDTFTFPLAFTTVYNVQATMIDDNGNFTQGDGVNVPGVVVRNVTNSSCDVVNDGFADNDIYIIALGYL